MNLCEKCKDGKTEGTKEFTATYPPNLVDENYVLMVTFPENYTGYLCEACYDTCFGKCKPGKPKEDK